METIVQPAVHPGATLLAAIAVPLDAQVLLHQAGVRVAVRPAKVNALQGVQHPVAAIVPQDALPNVKIVVLVDAMEIASFLVVARATVDVRPCVFQIVSDTRMRHLVLEHA